MIQYHPFLYQFALTLALSIGGLATARAQAINCRTPYGLNVTQVTATSASIYYSGANSSTPHSVTYSPVGSPSSAAIIITGTTSPIALTGLAPNTTYQLAFYTTCGASGQTSPVESLSFKNDCPSGTVYPYNENFDGTLAKATPCGYTVVDANGDEYGWSNYPVASASPPNAMRYTYSPTKAAYDWLFTRGLHMQAGMSYQLQFKYRSHSSFITEALEVKIGSAATAASQHTLLFTNTSITNTSYLTTTTGSGTGQVASFTPTASGIYYIGFHAISNANAFYVFVDDIQVNASAVMATRSPATPVFRAEAAPVPFGNQLTISLNTLQAGPLQLALHDAVRQHSTTVPAGASTLAVPDVAALPTGVYLLTVRQGGATQVLRVAHE